jgi:hypothetical protein
MPRFSEKDLMKKAHTLTEAWMWPNNEVRTEESKYHARVLRQILFEEMKARPPEFNAMKVQFVEELLGDCNPMGMVLQALHCDVDEEDLDLCLDRSFNEMLYGPSDNRIANALTPEQLEEATKQRAEMKSTMQTYLDEGVNPLAFSYRKLLKH